MKNAVFLFTCFLILFSCSTSVEQESTMQDRINEVVNDDLFYDYQILQLRFTEKLTNNEFNMDEIGKLLKSGYIPDCNSSNQFYVTLPQDVSNYFIEKCNIRVSYDKVANKYPDVFYNGSIHTSKLYELFVKTNDKFRNEQKLSIEKQTKNATNED